MGDSSEVVVTLGRSIIVYDARHVSHMSDSLFEPSSWPDAERVPGYSGGRGATLFVAHEDSEWVLKHYHRGGLMRHFVRDHFARFGVRRSRGFREWLLLSAMQSDGLPAPAPVAARCRLSGPVYTADLITRRIPHVEPLSRRLARGPLPEEAWQAVGACVARFHAKGYFHADLTAHNLQISPAGEMYLLDFDRGRRIRPARAWQRRNLDRLERSFRKLDGQGQIEFGADQWSWCLAGYSPVAGWSPGDPR